MCATGLMLGPFVSAEMNGIPGVGLWPAFHLFFVIAIIATLGKLDTEDHALLYEFATKCYFGANNLSQSTTSLLAARAYLPGFWISWGLCMLLLTVCWVLYSQLYKILHQRFIRLLPMPEPLKRNWKPLLGNFYLMTMSALALFGVLKADWARKGLELTTISPGGDAWGYGQTTAILLWLPLPYSALKELLSM